MNVFVLCTGRCGSVTFIKACGHITNYTASHESRCPLLGAARLAYPEDHIEADNRLSWLLGRLDQTYGDEAFYVHLIRDQKETALSFNRRWDDPLGILRGYCLGILTRTRPGLDVSLDYCETVSANIECFLKDKTKKMRFRLEHAEEDFREFWQRIRAEGDLGAALGEWKIKHNASRESAEALGANAPGDGQPFLSVVIPTYNRADLIQEAIESVLQQDYANYEILVVDDGSTDNTEEVVTAIKDERIRYVRKEHSNAPATRNRGVAEARGEFILWLDSDDVLLPGMFTRYLETQRQYPDVDVFYGDVIGTDAQLHEVQRFEFMEWYDRNDDLLAHQIRGSHVPNGGSMVRRECYERIGGYDESFLRAHDYEWWSRLIKVAQFKHIGGVFYKWRWHDSNITGDGRKADFSYEARIVLNMLQRYSLCELFPNAGWDTRPFEEAEAIACLTAAEILANWGDLANAREHVEKSLELWPSEVGRDALRQLEEFERGSAPSASAIQDAPSASKSPAEGQRVDGIRASASGTGERHTGRAEQGHEYYDDMYVSSERYQAHYKDSHYYVVWTQVLQFIKRVSSPRILELGCGPGQFAHYLHDEGYRAYHGFDFSPEAIAIAKRRVPQSFAVGDARERENFKHDYNLVISLEVLEHVEDDLAILRNIAPGAAIIFSLPTFDDPSHVRYFTDPQGIVERYGACVDIKEVVLIDKWFVCLGLVRQPVLGASVIWSAPLLEVGEEAADARQAVIGLDELGFAVKADPVKCRGQQEELPPEELGALERMAQRPIAEGFVHVQQVEPRFYQVTPDAVANIGRTSCGTDRIPAEWVMKCNALDEVWLPSDFALEAFAFSGVDRTRLHKAPPSINLEQFGEQVAPVKMADRRGFMFLSVLDWSARSGWGVLLQAYMEEFRAGEDVGLVLKFLLPPGVTEQMVAGEVRSYLKEALQLSGAIPKLNVQLDPVCPGLYRAADAFVLPSRAEGLGRHCLEAMASGLPVLATGWGGQTEFMNSENSYPVRYSLVDVPEPIAADEPELEGARWAEPSVEHLRSLMRHVFENREEAKEKGRKAREHIAANYNRERVAQQVKERLEAILEKVKKNLNEQNVPPMAPGRADASRAPIDDLGEYERQEFSQNGEDGVLEAIFNQIGVTNRYYVEFGCGDGTECNTALLRRKGWTGLLMDPGGLSNDPLATIHPEFITAENIGDLFRKYGVPQTFDLLSIDIDGNDYWVWEALDYHPRVIVIEYNSNIPSNESRTVEYDPGFRWDGTDYFGASLLALKRLGEEKGYTLVYCEKRGVNAFFVATPLAEGNFVAGSIQEIYRPPNLFDRGLGHAPNRQREMMFV